jgi:hypothetical protein
MYSRHSGSRAAFGLNYDRRSLNEGGVMRSDDDALAVAEARLRDFYELRARRTRPRP